jgi:hypothetical protein
MQSKQLEIKNNSLLPTAPGVVGLHADVSCLGKHQEGTLQIMGTFISATTLGLPQREKQTNYKNTLGLLSFHKNPGLTASFPGQSWPWTTQAFYTQQTQLPQAFLGGASQLSPAQAGSGTTGARKQAGKKHRA